MKMKLWKPGLNVLLFTAMLFTTASAHSHPGDPPPLQPAVSEWAQEEVERARDLGIVPISDYGFVYASDYGLASLADYSAPITRAQFRRVAVGFAALQLHCGISELEDMVSLYLGEKKDEYGYLKDVFTDGDQSDSIAYYLGIVQGRGDGTFNPDGLITRQEAAVMLTRAYSVYGGILPVAGAQTGFADNEKIADWAKESTEALALWDVMRGTGGGSFSPQGHYSVEQCIVSFLRLFENAPVSRKNGNITPLFTYEQVMEYIAPKPDGILHEVLRIEGPGVTFIRNDAGGVMRAGSHLYLAYRDGGLRELDLGICSSNYRYGITPLQKLEDPHFSEDGKTFYCTTTLLEDIVIYFESPEGRLFHKKGVYHITVDVDTGQYQLQREELP